MDLIDLEISYAFQKAVVEGDLGRFRALAKEFPQALENLRDGKLVDLAASLRKPELLMELVVRHGFEISHDFEPRNIQYDGELRAEGIDQIHRTLEVLADAVLGYPNPNGRSISCNQLRDKLTTKNNAPPDAINDEFLRCVQDGSLEAFIEKKMGDTRYSVISNRHTAKMLQALNDTTSRLGEWAKTVSPTRSFTMQTRDVPPFP